MTWPPREGRAFVALIASIGGAIAMTCFAGWLVWIFAWEPWPAGTAMKRLDWLGRALLISLGGGLLVLVTLGFAINRRTVKFGRGGFEASGGDDDPPPVPVEVVNTPSAPVPVEAGERRSGEL